ncbi:MAG TPA: ABC transporter ATP-binding protein [Pseudomonas pachastrellae]|nr:ABC transporter ATP-binding protein [Halopseudomonas pachastrellae]|tara:strand:+ start:426 stop:1238 length:813 start_codon:yes stop_codon:yes gene_type:complete
MNAAVEAVPLTVGQALRVSELSKAFRDRGREVLAVDRVSFDVAAHQVCILLGPSGCGKSTVLRMMAGLERPSSGEITLAGEPVRGPHRDRGMVFQGYTSFPWLTVRENVAYGLKINGDTLALREGTVDYFIDRVGLRRFADAYPHELSGGMRQRVALARALANAPKVLLMDEPFGALDAETRWQMQELLLDVVRKERMTVVMVTHDVEEGLLLGDRIAFMSRHPGRVRSLLQPPFKADGSISTREALRSHPQYAQMEQQILGMMRDEGSH